MKGQLFLVLVLIGAFVCVTCDESEEHLFDVVKRSAESELEAVAEIDPEEGELQIEPGQEDDRVYQLVKRSAKFFNLGNNQNQGRRGKRVRVQQGCGGGGLRGKRSAEPFLGRGISGGGGRRGQAGRRCPPARGGRGSSGHGK